MRPELGRRIRALRLQRGWNQEELAKRAKLHKNTVFKLESGQSDCLTSTLYKVAEGFKVDVRDLLMPLRRDAPAWVAQVEEDLRRASVRIEKLKRMPLTPEAREQLGQLERRIRQGQEDLQELRLRLGAEG